MNNVKFDLNSTESMNGKYVETVSYLEDEIAVYKQELCNCLLLILWNFIFNSISFTMIMG